MESGMTAIEATLKRVSTGWPSVTLLGSFILYVLGYLSIRFHLTVLGIGTDLSVLEERYFFAGAKFVIYLVATVPTVLLIAFFIVGILSLFYKFLPRAFRTHLATIFSHCIQWWLKGNRLVIAGIGFSVIMIQCVMRQCFFFSNLLVADSVQGPRWLVRLLVERSDEGRAIFFAGLVFGTLASGGMLAVAWRHRDQSEIRRILTGVLGFLFAVEVLLLPVNYGVLIVDKILPRVTRLNDSDKIQGGEKVWLVWEGDKSVTFLILDEKADKNSKTLVAYSRDEIKQVRICGYDAIIPTLFAGKQ